MMLVCALLFIGRAKQHAINLGRSGAITGISLEIVNAPAYLAAVAMFASLPFAMTIDIPMPLRWRSAG